MLPILIATGLAFALAVLLMSLGVIFGKRCLQGSCGGLAGLSDEHGRPLCESCHTPSADSAPAAPDLAPCGAPPPVLPCGQASCPGSACDRTREQSGEHSAACPEARELLGSDRQCDSGEPVGR